MTPLSATRLSLILIALALPGAPAYADSSDVPQWYGTIRFSKTLAKHTDDPPEFQGKPGKKFSDVKITWSGTMKFIPGNKALVVARYTVRREVDRKENKTNPCYWKDGPTAFHDYENLLETVQVTINREENNRLLFRLGADGAYRVSVIVGTGKHVPKAAKYRSYRETYNECSKPPLRIVPQNVEGSEGMQSVTLARIAGKAKPGATTVSGSYSAPDDDEGKLSYSWDLTLAEPQLVARAKATPGTVVRGESVTLDAKDSTGKIDKYEWQFTPDGDCQMTREGIALKLAGASVTFKALCDFTAELMVSNAKASDRTSQPVMVEARKGEPWTLKFKTTVAKAGLTKPITAGLIHAGVNQCTPHPIDEITGHWIHTTAKDNKTWREGGYVLAQPQDSGPFKDAWYVESQSLKVDRQEHVNSELKPGGANYDINVAKGNKRDSDDWVLQVTAHEAAHSALVKEKLDRLGPDGDPAIRIEKLVGAMPEKAFQETVDTKVREVESMLHEASTEAMVANRLRSQGFARPINIWVVGSGRDLFKKPLGPLWQIGHDIP